MDDHHSNKRFKSSSGAPIKVSSSSNASLKAYQPPTAPIVSATTSAGRANAAHGPAPSAPTQARSTANGKTSLRLTVKAPPSRLREATSGSTILPNPYASEGEGTPAAGSAVARGARSTRNPRTVVEPESDEEEEEGDEDEDDAESDGEDEDEDEDEDMKDRRRGVGSDVSGDDSDEDDDEEEDDEEEEAEEDDDEMEDELQQHHPPPPVINVERPSAKEKPHVTVTAPPEGTLKSVEDKEMDMGDDEDDDEDELSELDSNEDDEDHNGEGEGDDGLGSLSEDDNDDSRSATPDLSKLTRRQRGAYEEVVDSDLMALSNEAQKKKHLTAEEHAMRRAEMARRRKNLSEKRNEEEKMDTINKLLKKPAPKRRSRAEILAAQQADSLATPGAEEGEEEKPDPLYVRWVCNRDGSRIGVPEEWMEGPMGDIFRRDRTPGVTMVQEVA